VLEAVQEGEDDGLGLLGSASAKLAVLLIASASSRTRRGRRTVPQRDAEREQEASRPRQRQLGYRTHSRWAAAVRRRCRLQRH
jgi:hypothetical protein